MPLRGPTTLGVRKDEIGSWRAANIATGFAISELFEAELPSSTSSPATCELPARPSMVAPIQAAHNAIPTRAAPLNSGLSPQLAIVYGTIKDANKRRKRCVDGTCRCRVLSDEDIAARRAGGGARQRYAAGHPAE